MLPNLSSLTIAPDGPCRPCGSRRTAATGTKYGDPGWEMQPCGICTYPLGQDSSINPWAPNPAPYAGPCCVNDHAYHKGCIQQYVKKNRNENRNARCPECRAAILPNFLDVPPPPGVFFGNTPLQKAVDELLALDPTGATPHPVHGPIGGWDVSRVTDMNYLFFGRTQFNQPLNSWVVNNVENMQGMFQNATSFNQPLNSWNVSKVENMRGMFLNATSFNQPLNSWVVSNVKTMLGMFGSAKSFNQPLNEWNVSNVKTMLGMFSYAESFNQDLCGWIVRDGIDMDFMFDDATAFNRDPATRPPRRRSEVEAGGDCPPLPRGLTGQLSID